jgi:CRP-like cAMP-binding protein
VIQATDIGTLPRANRLLACLCDGEWVGIAPLLQPVHLRLGECLCESGDLLEYVYFPTTAILSLSYVSSDGDSTELALIGSDGVVGHAVFLGGNTTPNRVMVQCAGWAFRVKADVVSREFKLGGALQRLLLRYIQTLLIQVAQTAVCNRHHAVDQQLCRLLLLSLDRLEYPELTMTQELIGNMLGVRRESVTEAAGRLQRAGLIHYRRGHITVLKRAGIEARCCECYAVVKRETDRLLPALPAPTTHRTPQPLLPRVAIHTRHLAPRYRSPPSSITLDARVRSSVAQGGNASAAPE